MMRLRRPSDQQMRAFLERQSSLPYSYAEVGWTQGKLSPGELSRGFVVDHHCVQLGSGQAVFEEGKAALRRWQMFKLGWVQLCWPDAPMAVGTTVGVLAHGFGFWSLNACRIVYLIDDNFGEVGDAVQRYGFAYGTLPDHVERGATQA